MDEDRVDPEGCLRSLTAEALLWAYPQGPLFPVSLGVMAVANAFVMLGLLPEPLAEAILAEHRSELERQGFPLIPGGPDTGRQKASRQMRCWWHATSPRGVAGLLLHAGRPQ